MEDYRTIAQAYITSKTGDDFGLVEERVKNLEDFFCFLYQNVKFLKIRRPQDMSVGAGWVCISKEDKRIFAYGSQRGNLDETMKDLRSRIQKEQKIRKHFPDYDQQQRYGIKVTAITQQSLFIETMLSIGISFIILEVVGSSIFRLA